MADGSVSLGAPVELAWSYAPALWLLRLSRKHNGQALAAAAALGFELPTNTGRSIGSAHCLGPGEWLLEGSHGGRQEALDAAVAGSPAILADIGPGTSCLGIIGPVADDLLNKGCSIDFHSNEFPPGRCTRTLLAETEVAILRLSRETFRLYFDHSLSAWLRAWFDEASREFAPEGELR